jgi:aryl-alcohol dehydrogenase-like predicted oxidoreductase
MKNPDPNLNASLSRREFLGKTLAATMAITAATAATSSAQEPAAAANAAAKGNTRPLPFNPRTAAAMPMRNLGRTGFRVGIFSLGCQAAIEIKGNEKLSVDIMNRALDLGVNYFDTSNAYGNGASEEHVGLVVRDRRREVFLASKTTKRDYDGAMQHLDLSFKRMHTDHLDLWQIHNLQKMSDVEQMLAPNGALRAFQKAKSEGLTRFIGVTGHFEPNVLREMIQRAELDCILMAVNAADRHYLSFIDHLLPTALEKQMGIIGMKVATRGRMLSTWKPDPLEQQPERMRTSLPGTLTIAESLAYNFSLPVSTNIVGVDNVAQLEEDVKYAADFVPLSVDQMLALEERTLPIVRQGLYFRRWELGA